MGTTVVIKNIKKNIIFVFSQIIIIFVSLGCENKDIIQAKDLKQQIMLPSDWQKVEKKSNLQDFEFKQQDAYWLIKKYKKNMYIDNKNPQSYFLYGRLLGLFNQPNEALVFFYRALEQDPEYIWSFYSIGILYFRKNATLQAQIFLQKCLDLDFSFTPALVALAKIKLQKNPAETLILLQKAEKLSPENLEIKHHIANVFSIQKKYDIALSKYEECHKISQKNIDILNDWSKLLIKLKRYEEALKMLKKIYMLLPRNKKNGMHKTISLIRNLIKEDMDE